MISTDGNFLEVVLKTSRVWMETFWPQFPSWTNQNDVMWSPSEISMELVRAILDMIEGKISDE